MPKFSEGKELNTNKGSSLEKRLEYLERNLGSEVALTELFGVSDRTIRYWRLGSRNISKTALLLLQRIEKEIKKGKTFKRVTSKIPLRERLEVLEAKLSSDEAVGDLLGVSGRTVRHWKIGTRMISETALLLLERVESELLSKEAMNRLY